MILITGGLGFLGSYIAAYLATQKQKVVVTRHWRAEGPPFLKEPVNTGQIQVASCDVAKFEELLRVVEEYNVTSVVHAAHRPGYNKPEDFYGVCWNNLAADMNIGEVCRQAKLRVTFTSSSTVYEGLPKPGPMTEDMALPAVSSNLTGSFKRAGENILWMCATEFGLDLRIIRPPRIYGPYYRTYRNPAQRMVEAAAAGKSIDLPQVPGGGGGDFIYVEDLARVIGQVHLAEKTKHKIYNAGGGAFTSYRQIADIMERLRPGIRITLGDQEDGGLSKRWVDITRISQEFGYNPSYGIEGGHRAWLDWYLKGAT